MRSYATIDQFLAEMSKEKRLVATLGLFDGVHLGHQHLIRAMQEMAKAYDAESLVVTLDRHPLEVLKPELPRPRTLSSSAQKETLIAALGVDHLLVLPFTSQLAARSATQFVAPLQQAGLIGMMLGYDNRFGRKEPQLTRDAFDQRLREVGLQIERVNPFVLEGETVSSSRIRAAIARNDLSTAEHLLGRPFSITGRVHDGRQIGRSIGFPTANVIPYDSHLTLPAEGVYISEVRVGDKVYPAMSYYGSTPTITPGGEVINRIEAYLLDYSQDLYGQELEVAFRQFIRSDERFESLAKLQEQLHRDEQTTRDFFRHHPLALSLHPSTDNHQYQL